MNYACQPSQGYFGEIHYEHQNGVEHWLGGKQENAMCPNCHKTMLLLMSLDTQDPRMELTGLPMRHLPLMFCWTCIQGEIAYSLDKLGSFKLLLYKKSTRDPDYPYKNYPESFETSPLQLIPIPPDVQRAIEALTTDAEDDWDELGDYLELNIPAHQIGGMPFLIQHNVDERHICPKCGRDFAIFSGGWR